MDTDAATLQGHLTQSTLMGYPAGSPADSTSSQAAHSLPSRGLPPSPPASLRHAQVKVTSSTLAKRSTVTLILGILRLLCAGVEIHGIDQAWEQFRLSADEYAELNRRIELVDGLGEWYNFKCRYDYDGTYYALRMVTPLHEVLLSAVESTLVSAIHELAGNLNDTHPSAAAALRSVCLGRSTRTLFPPLIVENSRQETTELGVVKRCPDSSFYCFASVLESTAESTADVKPPSIYPTLVLEVSNSQSGKSLRRLAESYIIRSHLAIRCVLGLKLSYQAPQLPNTIADPTGSSSQDVRMVDKSATLSLWRPSIADDGVGICETVLDAVPFCDAVGRACEGALRLAISDLLPAAMFSRLASAAPTLTQHHLSIPFAILATHLNNAEVLHNALARQDHESSTTAIGSTPGTQDRFRERTRTPSGSLSEGREEAFVQLEQDESARAEAADETWQPRKEGDEGSAEE